MKKSLTLITVPVLAVLLIAGCSGKVKIYEDTEETVNTRVNQEFILAADADISSVYMWRADYDESMLELVASTFEIDEKAKQEGAVNILDQRFRFKALKEGKTRVTLAFSQLTLTEMLVAKEKVYEVIIK